MCAYIIHQFTRRITNNILNKYKQQHLVKFSITSSKMQFFLTDCHTYSSNVSSKNLMVLQGKIPWLMSFIILLTCLLVDALILLTEIWCWSLLRVEGLDRQTEESRSDVTNQWVLSKFKFRYKYRKGKKIVKNINGTSWLYQWEISYWYKTQKHNKKFWTKEVIQLNVLTLKPCFSPIWTHCVKHSTAWLRYLLEVENSA